MRRVQTAAVAIGLVFSVGCDDGVDPSSDAMVSSDARVPRVDGGPRPDSGTFVRPDGGPLEPDPCIAAGTCPFNTWIDVTPADANTGDYGPGPVVRDPLRPSHLYFGGYDDGVWRSTDYGNTWERRDESVDGDPDERVPSVAQGVAVAVLGTEPEATILVARGCACGELLKSTDGGRNFVTTGSGLPEGTDFYSFAVDPYDDDHVLSGLHEVDGIVESFDAGETWHLVGGSGFPSGGKSWYPDFIDNGDPEATRRTWFAIAQDGGSPVRTENSGESWTIPEGLEGRTHPHGASQIFQDGPHLYVAAVGGIYHSSDWGLTFTRVREGNYGMAWGSDSNVFAAWGWACGRPCEAGPEMVSSPRSSETWGPVATPGIGTGPMRVAITSDGEHTIYVAAMWWAGIWRYVEDP
jgi:photosystem II stability/assembly factor-like uncharacterized protein